MAKPTKNSPTPQPPPLQGGGVNARWPRWYAAVLLTLAIQIGLYYWFTEVWR